MELYIKILPDGEKKWYVCECEKCGWIGSSEHVGGGGAIADTGDYDDIYCPMCGSGYIADDVDNDQPITSFVERLKKSGEMVKKLREHVEGCDCSKHIYGHLEQENARMAKEIEDLKKLLTPQPTQQ